MAACQTGQRKQCEVEFNGRRKMSPKNYVFVIIIINCNDEKC